MNIECSAGLAFYSSKDVKFTEIVVTLHLEISTLFPTFAYEIVYFKKNTLMKDVSFRKDEIATKVLFGQNI